MPLETTGNEPQTQGKKQMTIHYGQNKVRHMAR